uniref:Uncharacterized protein n=1 Tax=Cacopsylla melanoneura TaxID=428564 RepID=A0A8D8U5T7_9HEMI
MLRYIENRYISIYFPAIYRYIFLTDISSIYRSAFRYISEFFFCFKIHYLKYLLFCSSFSRARLGGKKVDCGGKKVACGALIGSQDAILNVVSEKFTCSASLIQVSCRYLIQ